MAEIGFEYNQRKRMRGEDGAKRAKHYSSDHQILLVGEGDFSFSLSLARVFGSASNIVATSLDSYDRLILKYKSARTNLQLLSSYGAKLLHGVDAMKMVLDPDLQRRKFDRIIYNFPHAGFLGKEHDPQVIMMHKDLVHGFFKNASRMLRPGGEVHVTHKTTGPFQNWNIEELANDSSLMLLECVQFNIQDYPGYNNKRGDGSRPDEPFPLGECSTFKFILSVESNKSHHYCPQPYERPLKRGNGECYRIFKEYFDHAASTFGQADDHLSHSVRVMLGIGFERCKTVNHVNPVNEYVDHVKELRDLSRRRVAYLEDRLLELD